jgi:hypothetical protein
VDGSGDVGDCVRGADIEDDEEDVDNESASADGDRGIDGDGNSSGGGNEIGRACEWDPDCECLCGGNTAVTDESWLMRPMVKRVSNSPHRKGRIGKKNVR